jgi:asparagine synthase (glutamine-hydrolysing)
MSDVPLGAMLSGGLDSSLVVALMARHSAGRVKTFSVGFAGATNELDDARLVARHFGTDHHELELSVADAVDLPELVWTLDEPLADLSTIGFYGLSALAAQDVTVALSGQGADELLGGYRKHQAAALLARWQRLPQPLRRVPERLATGANGRLQRAGRALGAQDPVSRLLAMSGLVTNWSTSPLRSGALAEADGSVARAVLADRLRGYDGGPLETTLFLDAQLALVDHMLHYFDRASMAHSLEVRVPFLDHHVVELCARIPPGLKVRGLTTKYLLRRIAEPLVPARVLEKKKVGFFHSAVGAWLDGQAKAATAEYLLDERPQFAGFLDPQAVRSLVAKPDASGSERRLVLAILMLEVWLRTFVPRARVESRLPQRESLSA